ncbi:MAG: phosphoribosyltransferase family protein [Acidobacteriota bacterium]|nr:phosphoribosyltransferase family protein [Acidobacteriota bacterium]
MNRTIPEEMELEVLLAELRELIVERSIRYGEFTLASGASSAYYCDTKLSVLSPRGAALIGEGLYRLLLPHQVLGVGGLAMGAAYLATAVAMASDGREPEMYGFTVRNDDKDHGRGQKIDESWYPTGRPLIQPGRPVALVDDVVTSAGSVLRALDAVETAGCEVKVVAAVLDRQAGGADRIRERGYPFVALLAADAQGVVSPAINLGG